ncbi:MAG: hypothetical protein IJT25_02040 [Clostridia bacterium]|nr:hypothetical protein [Clostridia bacterium]
MSNIVFILLSGIFVANVCTTSGVAIPSLLAYKRSFAYTALMCALFAFILLASGVSYFFIYNYILLKFDVQFLSLMVLTVLIGIFSFIGYYALMGINKQAFYVYEKSYTFLLMFVSVLGVLLTVVADQEVINYILTLVFSSVGFLIVNFLVYGAYYKINSLQEPRFMRGLPLLLIMLALLGIVFSAINYLL